MTWARLSKLSMICVHALAIAHGVCERNINKPVKNQWVQWTGSIGNLTKCCHLIHHKLSKHPVQSVRKELFKWYHFHFSGTKLSDQNYIPLNGARLQLGISLLIGNRWSQAAHDKCGLWPGYDSNAVVITQLWSPNLANCQTYMRIILNTLA